MTGNEDFNILFTCAGRRISLLQAFRSALQTLGRNGKIIATDVTGASPAIHKADIGVLVPMARTEQYIPALLEQVKKHNVKLLVPLTDIDLIQLSERRKDFERLGCTMMIGSQEAIQSCSNKLNFHDFLAKAGLHTVNTLSLEDFNKKPFFPCFVKPIQGSAGIGSTVIRHEKDLHSHIEMYGQKLLIQEYLNGQEFTVDIYRSRDGKVRCVVPRQRLAVRSGEVEKGITVEDAQVFEAAAKLGGMIDGLWGVFCCQCRRMAPDQPPCFFEINPRFGGGAPLSIAAGANLPLYLLEEVMGLPISAKLGQFTRNLLMLRFDDALYIPVENIETLPGYKSPHFR